MVLPATERPANLRTILLAYPKRGRITKKYYPPVYIPGTCESGVKPGAIRGEIVDNWRLNALAQQPLFKQTTKYVFIPEPGCGSGVRPGALVGEGTSRSNDLCKPTLRYLGQAREAFLPLNGRVIKNLDKTIEQALNTVHNYYRKQMGEKQKKKEERMKKLTQEQDKKQKSPAQIKAERERKMTEWIEMGRALPKKEFPPEPISRGEPANLNQLKARMIHMAEPTYVTHKYLRPSIDPNYINPYGVKPNAKKYVASERVLELSKNPPHRLRKYPEIIPGSVKRAALRGPVPPRFDELAVPKKKAAEKDNDLKENPFDVSPFALKAKPTPRILELSKPIER